MTSILTAGTNDIMDILRHAAKTDELSYERQWQLDFDRDGDITTADALIAMRGVAGLSEPSIIPPIPESLEPLSEEIELKIKTDWLKPFESVNLADAWIKFYFGAYNDSIALMISDAFTAYAYSMWSEEVAGIWFVYRDGQPVYVWNDGEFYRLSLAYDKGLLTEQDLLNIQFYHSAEGIYSYDRDYGDFRYWKMGF